MGRNFANGTSGKKPWNNPAKVSFSAEELGLVSKARGSLGASEWCAAIVTRYLGGVGENGIDRPLPDLGKGARTHSVPFRIGEKEWHAIEGRRGVISRATWMRDLLLRTAAAMVSGEVSPVTLAA